MKTLLVLLLTICAYGQQFNCSQIPEGALGLNYKATVNGIGSFQPFAGSLSSFYADISGAAASANSVNYINTMNTGGADGRIRLIYPAGTFGTNEGRLYYVVDGSQPRMNFYFNNEDGTGLGVADPGPTPLPTYPRVGNITGPDPLINYELAQDNVNIVVGRDDCFLRESWRNMWRPGDYTLGSHAVWDMMAPVQQRPWGWPGSSVSGMPLFPGLIKDSEMAAAAAGDLDAIQHAIAFTSGNGIKSYSFTDMGSHHQFEAGTSTYNPNMPPFGAKFRLKASYDINQVDSWGVGVPEANQIKAVLRAFKKFGVVYVDGGMTGDIQGVVGESPLYFATWRLVNDSELKINPTYFEVVDITTPIRCHPNVVNCPNPWPEAPAAGALPVISSASANPSGENVIIRFHVDGASSRVAFVNRNVGAVAPGTQAYNPAGTYTYTVTAPKIDGVTTYDIQARNTLGITTQTVTLGEPETPPATLTITTTTLPAGTVGAPVDLTIGVSGGTGNFFWTIPSGSLPAGVNLLPFSGVLTGMPLETGVFTFSLRVQDDGTPPGMDTQAFTWDIDPETPPEPPPTGLPQFSGGRSRSGGGFRR